MKKRLAAIAGALLVAASIAGCSAEAANSGATQAATTKAAVQETTAAQTQATEAPTETVAEVNWPTEPINLYVPGAAGGATDTAARIVGDYLEKVTGGTVVIQNEPTGAGAVMLETLRTNDNPDYNIAMVGSQAITLLLNGQYEYDVRDQEQFTVLNRVINGAHSNVFVCSKNAPFANYDEFVAYAKENPGKVKVAVETGSLSNIYTSIITEGSGIEVKLLQASHSEQVTNVIGGMADCFVSAYNTLEGYDGTGELVPLVVIGTAREEKYPDVPCLTDIGLGDRYATGGQFIIASGDMDPAVVEKLNELFKELPNDPEFVERATATNNILDVIPHEDSGALYSDVTDMYASIQ